MFFSIASALKSIDDLIINKINIEKFDSAKNCLIDVQNKIGEVILFSELPAYSLIYYLGEEDACFIFETSTFLSSNESINNKILQLSE